MHRRLLFLIFAFAALTLYAQEQSTQSAAIEHAPISGPKLYQAYCAVCHGGDGKGNGPMATALKTPPRDLTTIAKRNDGAFPTLHVIEAINGDRLSSAHATRDMPVWGPVFRSMAHGHADNAQLRVTNLTSYIESLQEK